MTYSRLIAYLLVAATFASCAKRRKKVESFEPMGDFSLGDIDEDGPGLKRPLAAPETAPNQDQFSRPSQPLPLKVGKGRDSFATVPSGAEPPVAAYQVTKFGNCIIGIKTGPLEVDRYMYISDRWVKLQTSLPPKIPVRIELGMDVYLTFTSNLQVYLLKSKFQACADMFRGKRQFLGKVSLNKSAMGLIAAPESPKKVLKKGKKRHSVGVYLKWRPDEDYPVLEDQNGIRITIQAPMYNVKMTEDGFYYLTIRPLLDLRAK